MGKAHPSLLRIAHDARRVAARGNRLQLQAQQPAQQRDAAIAGAQVLGRVRGEAWGAESGTDRLVVVRH